MSLTLLLTECFLLIMHSCIILFRVAELLGYIRCITHIYQLNLLLDWLVSFVYIITPSRACGYDNTMYDLSSNELLCHWYYFLYGIRMMEAKSDLKQLKGLNKKLELLKF